jgi:hypothetical protein
MWFRPTYFVNVTALLFAVCVTIVSEKTMLATGVVVGSIITKIT